MSWTIESIQIADVDPAAVFALYFDPATWSRWGHNATWARSDGPLVAGGTVQVRASYGKIYHCLIRRLEPGRALELVVRPAFLSIINTYEVEPTPSGARVRHALDVSGPLATPSRVAVAGLYQRQLDDEVRAVIRIASGRDPGPAQGTRVTRGEQIWHGLGRIGRRVRGRDD